MFGFNINMITLNKLDNAIIANSVQTTVKPNIQPEQKPEISDKKSMTGQMLLGASGLAAIVIAGIYIAKGKKVKPPENVSNPSKLEPKNNTDIEIPEPLKPLVDEVKNVFDEAAEKLRENFEKPLREKIAEAFKKFKTQKIDEMNFASRVETVTAKDVNKMKFEKSLFPNSDSKIIVKYLKDFQYDAKLRAGLEVEGRDALNRIIETSQPLSEKAVVYYGLRTKKIWDDFSKIDLGFKEGEIIDNKGFTTTLRAYNDILAGVDPVNFVEHPDCGYIMRIVLPENTKGIDCRRFTGKDLDTGYNGVYILPEKSQFKINKIDEENRIIDCEYLLK